MIKGSTLGQDPSIEWFFNDWAGGTATLSRHLKGCYMDVMHAQFNNGHLSLDEIKTVLGSDFGNAWPTLQKKFVTDDKGLYYQKRLKIQMVKKFEYNKSRRGNYDNLSDITIIQERMGNGIGDSSSKDLLLRKGEFISDVNLFLEYSEKMRIDFCDYWTECSKGARKMRFEKEKTFEIAKRLARWKNNNLEKNATTQKTGNGSILNAWK